MGPIDVVLVLALVAMLIENRTPVIPAAAIGVLGLRGAVARVTEGLGFRRTEWAVVGCLAYWLANYCWSGGDWDNLTSFKFLRNDGALLVTYPVFVLFLGWPWKPKQCRIFWLTFLAVFSVIGLIGMALSLRLPLPYYFEDLGLVGWDEGAGAYMFSGWYESHNTAGGVFCMATLAALALLQEGRLSRRSKPWAWMLFLSCFGGLAFSLSRSAYLGFVAGAALILPLRKFSKMLKIGVVAVVPTALLVLMSSSVMNRIDTITDPYYGTNAARFDIWSEALYDFELSPIVGIGFGRWNDYMLQFEGVKHFVYVAVSGQVVNNDSHAHNSTLHWLAEGGVVGAFLTLLVWWCAWSELSFYDRELPNSKMRWLHRGAKACLPAAVVMSMTEHMLGRGTVALALMAVVGTTLAAARKEWKALRHSKQVPLGVTDSRAALPRVTGPRWAVR